MGSEAQWNRNLGGLMSLLAHDVRRLVSGGCKPEARKFRQSNFVPATISARIQVNERVAIAASSAKAKCLPAPFLA
jgi:hypothetical protein